MALFDFLKGTSQEVVKTEPVLENKSPVAEAQNNNTLLHNVESFSEALGLTSSMGGIAVNPTNSMKLSIVYACTRLLAGAMAQMGKHVYRDVNGQRERVSNHPTASLLSLEPTAIWSASTFWEWVMMVVLLQGDAIAVIYRNRNGEPLEILPIPFQDWIVEKKDGRLLYSVLIDGRIYGFDQDDVLHFPGFGFNGLRSMSVIQWGAYNSIGLELAMESYSKDFFETGATQRYAVIKDSKWGSDQKRDFREAWAKTYGGASNSNMPIAISGGLKLQELSVNAKDSQLLESREFQITEIARAFGLPSFMVNQEQKSTSWGSGISEISLIFTRFTMMPHVGRFEEEVNRKLFKYSPEFFECSAESLQRGTQKERYEQYQKALGGSSGPGFMTQNEVRRLENLPKINKKEYDELYDPRKFTQSENTDARQD